MRARSRSQAAGLAVLLACFATLIACNPLLDQATTNNVAQTSWAGHKYTYHGPSGWLAVRVDNDGGVSQTLSATATILTADGVTAPTCYGDGAGGIDVSMPCSGSACVYSSPERVLWSDGSTRGYKRMLSVRDGELFQVWISGAAESVAPDVGVFDASGSPTSGSLHDETPGPPGTGFIAIGWPIC